jgi:hypothetical protein
MYELQYKDQAIPARAAPSVTPALASPLNGVSQAAEA